MKISREEYFRFTPFKAGVNIASTGLIPHVHAIQPGDYLDGVQIRVGMIIMIKDQYNTSENGIYLITKTGPVLTHWDVGQIFVVQLGEQNALKMFQCTNKYVFTERKFCTECNNGS